MNGQCLPVIQITHNQKTLKLCFIGKLNCSIFRRLCDEEDELSEVEPDAVPSEVRDWLALTFTRSMSNIKRRGDDKPKFRSGANAIRAGIMVDRYANVFYSSNVHKLSFLVAKFIFLTFAGFMYY